MRFLKENMYLQALIEAIRGRFEEINALLLEKNINKHDLGHQMRTASGAVRGMQMLGFSHRDQVLGGFASITHDIGYNRADPPKAEDLNDVYHGGNKAHFKQHALSGAREAREWLGMLLKAAPTSPEIAKIITYKDADGKEQRLDEKDIEVIVEAILNHNDYGKDDANYDPRKIGKTALMVQLFDKLDNCRQRVYKEHIEPSAFIEGNPEFDKKYFHRAVPYCISHYDFNIDRQAGVMHINYQTDIEDFTQAVRAEFPNFEYSEAHFVEDFKKAYTKNCQIAAEAAGTVMESAGLRPTLMVTLNFASGNQVTLPFSRPDREIYEVEKNAGPGMAKCAPSKADSKVA